MNGEELNRLTILETKFKERFDSWDQRANERHSLLVEKFNDISEKLNLLPCSYHGEDIRATKARVTLFIGFIIPLILAILAAIFKLYLP